MEKPMAENEDHKNTESIRATIGHLQDFLNNPESKYTPQEIWSDDFQEKRRWPFSRGTGREGKYSMT